MNIYLLADGLAEDFSKTQTTLESCIHSNIDNLSKLEFKGLYEPARRPNVPNPETYVIFPYFFGLHPDNNPARGGLEILGSGINLDEYPLTGIFRLISKDYNIRNGWDGVPKFENNDVVYGIVDNISDEFENLIKITKSKISKKGNVWCFAAKDYESMEDMLNTMQYESSKHNLNSYPMLFEETTSPVEKVSRNSDIYGWTTGSLLDAFRALGIKDSQNMSLNFDQLIFNYGEKISDFKNNILPKLEGNQSSDGNSIIYIKEPSSASRKIGQGEKIKSIDFIDEIVGNIWDRFYGTDNNLIFLVDHQSNIGVERTYPGPTIYSYGNLSNSSNQTFEFNERNLYNHNPKIIEQKDLILGLNNYLK